MSTHFEWNKNLSLSSYKVFCIFGEAAWSYTVEWIAGELCCKMVKYFQLFALYLSTYVLVLIGIDRWVAVKYPMKSLNMAQRCHRLLILSYILSLIMSLPQVSVGNFFSPLDSFRFHHSSFFLFATFALEYQFQSFLAPNCFFCFGMVCTLFHRRPMIMIFSKLILFYLLNCFSTILHEKKSNRKQLFYTSKTQQIKRKVLVDFLFSLNEIK